MDGLITVDPSGTISDVNEQMCRMTAYAREELIGSRPIDGTDDGLPALGQREDPLAAVLRLLPPLDEAAPRQPVHEA